MNIQSNLLKARSGIEIEVGLWYLWLVLEEVLDERQQIPTVYKTDVLNRVIKIQSMAFRLSQRYSFVGGKHTKPEPTRRPRIRRPSPGFVPAIPASIALHEPLKSYPQFNKQSPDA